MGNRPSGFGYLHKPRIGDLEEFVASIRRIANGGTALEPAVVSYLAGRQPSHDPLDDLTPRELQVLELIADGRSNRSIAEGLVVTVAAVERHITATFAKLSLQPNSADHRRVLATLRYLSGRSPRAKIAAPPIVSAQPFQRPLARNGGTNGRVSIDSQLVSSNVKPRRILK